MATVLVPPCIVLLLWYMRRKSGNIGLQAISEPVWPEVIGADFFNRDRPLFNVLDTSAPASAFDVPIGEDLAPGTLFGDLQSHSAMEYSLYDNFTTLNYTTEAFIYESWRDYLEITNSTEKKELATVALNFTGDSFADGSAVALEIATLACAPVEPSAPSEMVSDLCLIRSHAMLLELLAHQYEADAIATWKAPTSIFLQRRPKATLQDGLYVQGELYAIIAWIVVLGGGSRYVVEKQTRMRQRLAMAGASPALQVSAWVTFVFLQAFSCFLLFSILLVAFSDPMGEIITTPLLLFFTFISSFQISLVTFLFTSVFSKPNSFIFFCLACAVMSFIVVQFEPETLPLFSLGYAFRQGKEAFTGRSDDSLGLVEVLFDTFSAGDKSPRAVCHRVFLNALWTSPLLFLLGLYMERVMPQQYAQAASPFFPIFWLYRTVRGWFGSEADIDKVDLTPEVLNDVDATEDASVTLERQRVADMAEKPALVIQNLKKVYPGSDLNPPVTAVKRLTLAVSQGECFGLCGANGSGKSTTIECISGSLKITDGTAFVDGLDVTSPGDRELIGNRLGVCPQHDCVWGELSALEHFRLFMALSRSRLIGTAEESRNMFATIRDDAYELADRLGLVAARSENKRAVSLSGGQRRRVSVGLALTGAPSVVILDEPSTGIDPKTRRDIWALVADLKRDHAVVLTSHDMAECEVLCDRVCIMVSGEMRAIGTVKELGTRLEYEASVNAIFSDENDTESATNKSVDACCLAWPGCHALEQKFSGFATIQLPRLDNDEVLRDLKAGISVPTIEGVIRQLKGLVREGVLKDFTISSASLHDIFLDTVDFH